MSDFAIGLPSRKTTHPISGTGDTRLVIQRHKATSDHYDMRLQEGDIAHSWVVRSLPGEKDKTLAIRQPTHRASYMEFEGTIPEGYGAGTVKKVYDEPVEILKASDKSIHMVLPEGEFKMIHLPKMGEDKWLMLRLKNTIPDPITSKPEMKDISKKELNFDDPNVVWQPKVDGGHTIFRLNSDGPNRAYSYRTSKAEGIPIEHTHQVPHLRDLPVPKDLNGVEVRGEIYAIGKNRKPLEAHEVGGILNSGIMESREKQLQNGLLKPYLFKVVKWKDGKNVENAPYSEQIKMLDELSHKAPGFRRADIARTTEEKQLMFNSISNKTHPDTKEGIVEVDLNAPGGDPRKYKIRDTHEVVIRDIFPAETIKTGKKIAGGFGYSWTPEGPVVGKVGTGFKEWMKKKMFENPEEFIGRIARIKTQQVFKSGAARAPSFYEMHVEKNLAKAASMDYIYDMNRFEKIAFFGVDPNMVVQLAMHLNSQIPHLTETIGLGAKHHVGEFMEAARSAAKGHGKIYGTAAPTVLGHEVGMHLSEKATRPGGVLHETSMLSSVGEAANKSIAGNEKFRSDAYKRLASKQKSPLKRLWMRAKGKAMSPDLITLEGTNMGAGAVGMGVGEAIGGSVGHTVSGIMGLPGVPFTATAAVPRFFANLADSRATAAKHLKRIGYKPPPSLWGRIKGGIGGMFGGEKTSAYHNIVEQSFSNELEKLASQYS